MSNNPQNPITPRKTKRYGWRPDLPDHRDVLYAAPYETIRALPASVNLVEGCPPVYDQSELGSCTANAIAAAFEFDLKKDKKADFMPSRLFIYYNERAMEGTVNEDAGAVIRDGVKSVAKIGVCREDDWPYDLNKFAESPSRTCYSEAAKHRVLRYMRLPQVLSQLKGCLASGFPFVFGFTVYESFESPEVAKTGDAPLPVADEGVLGGHAVMAVGYDDKTQRFLVRNSWGAHWGKKGYFTMPYQYLLDTGLSADFWTIRQVTG